MNKTLSIGLVSLIAATANGATVLYDADFSTDGQGVTHSTAGGFSDTSPYSGANWILTFDSPSTDSGGNQFITAGGLMSVLDWGGDGTITSLGITIAETGAVNITGAGLAVGSDVFNIVGNEGITWFYSINSGAPVTVFLGETELGGPVAAGTDVGNSFTNVAVTAGDTLEVGFTVNVNGGGDGVDISSLSVETVPEPSTALLGGLALLGFLRRKR